ncbi:MAG: glycosyltransferase [Syntrophomonadaceae bacterium]|nr:glycosyltransferase [Syntrophomonadaceae bacterium]
MNPRVMIGCPVRNRAWILPRYLECLCRIEYPKDLIEFCFIINNSIDNTENILQHFARDNSSPVRLIKVDIAEEYAHKRGFYSFKHLAFLRNLLLNEFQNSACQFLFSVDSDILVPPHSLSRLIQNQCDIVSGLVCNGHHLNDSRIYNILNWTDNNRLQHVKDFPRDRLFPVDCTGAAYLISRNVVEGHGIRYSHLMGPEDIGFCMEAAKKGVKIYCDGRIEFIHVMDEPNPNLNPS